MSHRLVFACLAPCLLVAGCGGAGPDLEGTWVDPQTGWRLEFAGQTVREWEDGASQNEAVFEVRTEGGRTVLVIRDDDRTAYSIIEIDGNRLRITEPRPAVPGPADDVPTLSLERSE